MEVKGVCYDVGRVMQGSNWRPNFDPVTVKGELEIIKRDLHANAVRICGLDLERLETASEAALALGLEVWFSPEMWDQPQDDTLKYLIKAAQIAEGLRIRHGGHVVFSVGSELTLFMQGILEGNNIFERMHSSSFLESIRSGKANDILNSFLRLASSKVSEHFHGPLTYFSVPFEKVSWELFAYVGVDLYRDARTKETFDQITASYLKFGKPLIIGETGCCTYQGAEKLGGTGFIASFGMIENYLGETAELTDVLPNALEQPPKKDGHYLRDEKLQAREIVEQLDIFNEVGVAGAFVFTFVSQNSPFNPDPRCDLDMAGYSLVKSYPDEKTLEQFIGMAANQVNASTGPDALREFIQGFLADIGKHGTTYSEMPWEPKESFWSVGKFFLEL